MKNNLGRSINPMQNVLLKNEIEKLQSELSIENEKYVEALKQDKILSEIKPIRLQIRFLREKIETL